MLSGVSNSYQMAGFKNKAIVIVTDPNLLFYMTMEQMYSSTKSNWTSGTYYLGNIATGPVTDIFQGYSLTSAIPETTIVKNGLQSIYTNQNLFRQTNATYVFPQSTGLSFCVWNRMVGQNPANSYGGVFGLCSTTDKLLALRMRSVGAIGSGAPYYLNLSIDGSNFGGGGTDITSQQITNNVWNHYVWTISPALYGSTATHKIYMNNVLIYTNATLLYPTNVVRAYFDLGANANNGCNIQYIDTFRHYKKELTSTEINNIYTNLDPNGLRV
jgi:hypothetical protein